MSGAFQAGDRLSPGELAKRFDVSPMPVREALIALSKVGIVEMHARRGFRVSHVSWRDVDDAFSVHAFISGRLGGFAAVNITPEAIGQLRQLQAEIEAAEHHHDVRRAEEIDSLNYEFHRTINVYARGKTLIDLLRSVSDIIPRHLHAQVPGWIETTVGDHPAIIDALEAHDASAAQHLIEQHILLAGNLVLSKLTAARSWDSGPTVADETLPRP